MPKYREVKIAIIVFNSGVRSIYGTYFADDQDAFYELMDEMQHMCQKDTNINSFSFESVSPRGDMQEACQNV